MFSFAILLCFMLAVLGGVAYAVYLPAAVGAVHVDDLPTLNSKGISCFPKAEHGAVAGVILFFTCVAAVLAPLAMGAVSDALGQIIYGFWLATGFAALLFIGMLLNWLVNPARTVLEQLDQTGVQVRRRARRPARRHGSCVTYRWPDPESAD